MASVMEPWEAQLPALTQLTKRVYEMLDKTKASAKMPYVEGIRMLAEAADKYVKMIHANVGKMSTMKKNGRLTDKEKNEVMEKNLELQIRAEKLDEIAWPAYETWKAQKKPESKSQQEIPALD